ncbi:helix-turn-helix transcriptional regulator [Aquisalinus flavus]|uniref:HTH luxR-type domain-containing protein n=1 Tax=Aquisalinus flavus TaxID=1526572 RepID=A0A8J2Y4X5_9PROT|nr:helix-turn-helix transcriptional regulator [Aquisalinus flavus]MBD0427858.1 helix-turn-helix transcriptional regulator [Aquisalinus flavus]UNE47622.1 helix-turn-helix transcriptional regulator [Aquisalinus flavus]GGD04438.1 hypothetical protein GCM10011342_11750 [Aquisalinus flavus]
MGTTDQLLTAIETIHHAGLDPAQWPAALDAITRHIGCWHASLECYDPEGERHLYWHGHGINPDLAEDYISFCHESGLTKLRDGTMKPAPLPRSNIITADGRKTAPFYASTDYLKCTDTRDFAAGILKDEDDRQVILTLRRNPAQGNIDQICLVELARLLPHVRLALDVSARLGSAAGMERSLAATLDWIDQGAALLTGDGKIVHANAAFVDMASTRWGTFLKNGAVEFTGKTARDRFRAAMQMAASMLDKPGAPSPASFLVPGLNGGTALSATVRPVFPSERAGLPSQARFILFLRAPAGDSDARISDIAAAASLTMAESRLAVALINGTSPALYARLLGLSTNTVYTHLRHLKEKLDAGRLPELIGKLNDLASAGIRANLPRTAPDHHAPAPSSSNRSSSSGLRSCGNAARPLGRRRLSGDGYSFEMAARLP